MFPRRKGGNKVAQGKGRKRGGSKRQTDRQIDRDRPAILTWPPILGGKLWRLIESLFADTFQELIIIVRVKSVTTDQVGMASELIKKGKEKS